MTESGTTETARSRVDPWHAAVAIIASIGGVLVHNLAEFPPSILVEPETLVPMMVTVLIGAALLQRPRHAVFLVAVGWATVVIVFGGGSVHPLPIWPFEPEQTVGHYLAHLVYALAQVPPLWIGWRGYRLSS